MNPYRYKFLELSFVDSLARLGLPLQRDFFDKFFDYYAPRGVHNRETLKSSMQQTFDFVKDEEVITRLRLLNSETLGEIISYIINGSATVSLVDYLDALKIANSPKPVFLLNNLKNIQEFQESLLAASDSNHIYSDLSPEFKEAVGRNILISNHGSSEFWTETKPYLTSIFVLRSVYSESLITEVLNYTGSYKLNESLSIRVFSKLLKDWDNLKHLPLPWNLKLINESESIQLLERNMNECEV